MDWGNEPYARLFKRKTAEYLALCWQAKAIRGPLLMETDRSGIIQVPLGERRLRLLAGLLGMPLEVVEAGMGGTAEGSGLLEDGCIVECDPGYLWPHYLEANETPASDAQRMREMRGRRRDLAEATKRGVTFRNKVFGGGVSTNGAPDENRTSTVTKRNQVSRNVTDRYETPPSVTQYSAVPSSLGTQSSKSDASGVDGRRSPRRARQDRETERQKGAQARPREKPSNGHDATTSVDLPSASLDAWLTGAATRRAAWGGQGLDPPPRDPARVLLAKALKEHGASLLAEAHALWLHQPGKLRCDKDGRPTRAFIASASIAEWVSRVPPVPSCARCERIVDELAHGSYGPNREGLCRGCADVLPDDSWKPEVWNPWVRTGPAWANGAH